MAPRLQEILDTNPGAVAFRFGEEQALCEEILALVRAGRKTATSEAARAFGPGGEVMPKAGRRDVVLDWDGNPALLIETQSVEIRTWRDIDMAFVRDHGEFRDLAQWQQAYRAHFERTGGWSEDLEIMCEWFRVIEDYAEVAA